MKHQNKIWIYSLVVIFGLIAFLSYRYIGSRLWGLEYPWNSFLFLPNDRFMDFFNINQMVADFDPYTDNSSYPPLALVAAYFFAWIIPGSASKTAMEVRDEGLTGKMWLLAMYSVCLIIIMIAVCRRIFTTIPKEVRLIPKLIFLGTISLSIILSAPVIYAFDRGNYLIVCVLFLTLFCLYYDKNDYAAAVFLAVAASLKVFPVLLFFVFFLGKKWKPLFVGLFTGAVSTLVCAAVLQGGLIQNLWRFTRSLLGFSSGPDPYSSYYYRYAIGLRTFIGTSFIAIKSYIPPIVPITQLTLAVSALLVILVIIMCVMDKRVWRQILYLSFLMVLVPTPSFYYNLAYLIGPVFLFLLKEKQEKYDMLFLGGFCFLMIPTSYYFFLATCSEGLVWIGINCLLDPLIMIILLSISFFELLYIRFHKKKSIQDGINV